MRKFMLKSLALGLPLLVGGVLPATCQISGIPGFGFLSVNADDDDDDDFWDDLEDLFDD